MKRLHSKALLALIAAGTLLAATPALAFPAWQCTAKNARGAKYTAATIGIVSAVVHERAKAKAVTFCALGSLAPTCRVVSCIQIAK